MTPPCYNRPPRAAGQWLPTGRTKRVPTRRRVLGFVIRSDPKPVLRWVPAFSEDRCATHDGRGIGPKGESYPDAHGWDCSGCRWRPFGMPHTIELVDKPADNPGVIHTPEELARVRMTIVEQIAAAGSFWGDPPETISHGKATDAELADLDVRKAITRRAADYAAKHGVPVNLTCGDTVVETIFPPEVYR